jgi:hypothetical protein
MNRISVKTHFVGFEVLNSGGYEELYFLGYNARVDR